MPRGSFQFPLAVHLTARCSCFHNCYNVNVCLIVCVIVCFCVFFHLFFSFLFLLFAPFFFSFFCSFVPASSFLFHSLACRQLDLDVVLPLKQRIIAQYGDQVKDKSTLKSVMATCQVGFLLTYFNDFTFLLNILFLRVHVLGVFHGQDASACDWKRCRAEPQPPRGPSMYFSVIFFFEKSAFFSL